jgi:DNA primase
MGLCPLHAEHQPSFLVDPAKNLFYCYGCGRGGDLIRFVELYFAMGSRDAMTLLRSTHRQPLLKDVVRFYQIQLHRHSEAAHYLLLRGIQQPQMIEELAIGYTPGRCLWPWLMALGYSLSELQQVGLVNAAGHDTLSRRVVFAATRSRSHGALLSK